MAREYITLKVKRQDNPKSAPYWEEFKIPYRPNMNVISTLMEVRKNPVNSKGQKTSAPVWECNCLEEVCGACTMVINGVPRQSCAALIDKLPDGVVTLEPLSKFPIVRDLIVDREKMFENLKRVKAWNEVDGSWNLGRGPRFRETDRQWAYVISKCMTCGCCTEACPNFNEKASFVGPFAIAQVRNHNIHPIGDQTKEMRLDALLEEGGIADCGNSQNCVRVCPKHIPLTTHIAAMNRDTTLYSISRWLKKGAEAAVETAG